jgi:hypothetical protein
MYFNPKRSKALYHYPMSGIAIAKVHFFLSFVIE